MGPCVGRCASAMALTWEVAATSGRTCKGFRLLAVERLPEGSYFGQVLNQSGRCKPRGVTCAALPL